MRLSYLVVVANATFTLGAENPKYDETHTLNPLHVIFAKPVLSAAGFCEIGIRGGSLASAVQSHIGNVEAGGKFATLQSAGMNGYGAAVVNQLAQGVGAALWLAPAAMVAKELMKEKDDNKAEKD